MSDEEYEYNFDPEEMVDEEEFEYEEQYEPTEEGDLIFITVANIFLMKRII